MSDTADRPKGPSGAVRTACLAAAIACAGVLGFAIVTKALALQGKKELLGSFGFEHAVMGAELLLIALVLIFRKRWLIWTGVAVLFAAFSGYTFFHVMKGGSCGCFGNFTPPSEVMVGIDLAMVTLAVIVAILLRVPKAVLGATVIASLAALLGGNLFSYTRTAEYVAKQYGDDAKGRLLACDLGKEMREAGPGGPAFLVFIHEIGCHTCEQYLGGMEAWKAELDQNENPHLRVRVWSKDEVNDACGIEDWAWEGPPHSFVVINGQPAMFPDGTPMEWLGEDTPFTLVEDLQAMLEADSMYPLFE